jgi:hypothetical protein
MYTKAVTEQVPTCTTSALTVMRRAAFRRGVEDVRAGRPFDDWFGGDDINKCWDYERGRQWALLAPPTMPLRIDARINPAALALFLESGIL